MAVLFIGKGENGADKKKDPVQVMSNNGSMLKALIPYMPLPVAVICLILNIFLPGVGESVLYQH